MIRLNERLASGFKVEGFYAASALIKEYQIQPVWVVSRSEGTAAVEAGNCTALAWDSSAPPSTMGGLVQAGGVPPVQTAPYGIPVMKGADLLTDRLTTAMVRLMEHGPDR